MLHKKILIPKENPIEIMTKLGSLHNYISFVNLNKDVIESETGLNFDWRELPAKKASRIVIAKQVSFVNKNLWNEQFNWLVDVMIKVKKTFSHYI